jgi:hypothetical protein
MVIERRGNSYTCRVQTNKLAKEITNLSSVESALSSSVATYARHFRFEQLSIVAEKLW